MRLELLFAGIGGQGIRLMGDILARAIVEELDLYATVITRYTPEVRGGPIHVEIVISDEPVDYPRVFRPVITVILHDKPYFEDQEVYDAVSEVLAAIKSSERGLKIIADEELAGKAPGVHLELSAEAARVGGRINMLALGYVVALLKDYIPIEVEHVVNALRRTTTRNFEKNVAAIKRGFELAIRTAGDEGP